MNDLDYSGYLKDLSGSQLSFQTKRAYASRFRQFMQFLADHPATMQCAPAQQCALFLQHLEMNEQLRAASINAYRSSLLHCMQCTGLLEERSLPERLPAEQAVIIRLSVEQFEEYLKTVCESENERDKAVCLLVALDGLGPKRCASLKVGDLLFEEGEVRLKKAGGDDLRLHTLTRTALIAYRPELFHAQLADDEAVLLNRFGRAITEQSVDYVVRTIGLRCGLVVCARTLRYSSRFYANR